MVIFYGYFRYEILILLEGDFRELFSCKFEFNELEI